MANWTSNQNNLVSAGRFIEISSNSISARERLNALRTVLANSSLEGEINYMQGVLGDRLLSVDEKASFKSRWETRSENYNRFIDSANDVFPENNETMQALKRLYNYLNGEIQKLTADMTTDSKLPFDFADKMEEFLVQFDALSTEYAIYLNTLARYVIELSADKTSYDSDDTVNVTARLLLDGEEVPNTYYSRLDIVWECMNRQNEQVLDMSSFKTNEISFPASNFQGSITLQCSMLIPTTSS